MLGSAPRRGAAPAAGRGASQGAHDQGRTNAGATERKEQTMAERHVLSEEIDAVIREGLTVYDAGGAKIGVVKQYSPSAAYLVVQTGLLAPHKDLYVPYSAIRSIDPRDLFLTKDKA